MAILTENQKQALNGLEEARDRKDTYRTSTGVTLKLKRVSPMIVYDATNAMKAPRPPLVLIEGKSEPEENILDPDFHAAMEAFEREKGTLASTVYLTLGTKVDFTDYPSDMPKPTDTDWSEQLEELTDVLNIPEKGIKRYFAWLMYVALTSPLETAEVIQRIMRLSGVVEEADVVNAMESFRRDEGRDTDSGSIVEPESESEDSDEDIADSDSPVGQ